MQFSEKNDVPLGSKKTVNDVIKTNLKDNQEISSSLQDTEPGTSDCSYSVTNLLAYLAADSATRLIASGLSRKRMIQKNVSDGSSD